MSDSAEKSLVDDVIMVTSQENQDDDKLFKMSDVELNSTSQVTKLNTKHQHISNLTLNTHKAGMQGFDAAKINEIIRKASEGSRFYQHKQQAQQKLDAKIKEMLHTAQQMSPQLLEKATKKMEAVALECEAGRDLSRTIVHVDMDMFYAAVEMRDQPNLKDVPMAVGGNSMLSTSNYIARKFGVRAGMPGFIARQLCPALVLVPPNFSKYKAVSRVVEQVFAIYDPNYAMMSLDEAYLDITDYMEANAYAYRAKSEVDNETLAEAIVREMRLKIQEATQLTASAGIAANTRLAKVCSDLNKPNGQYYLPSDTRAIMDFINKLPIRKISGIGNVTEQQLKALGITLCGQIRPNYGLLRLLFSDCSLDYFVRISLGLGETDLSNYTSGEQKSISTETTFTGTSCKQKLMQMVSDLSIELHGDMKKKGLVGKLVTLKTKTVNFVLKTRSMALGEPTSDPEVMGKVARKLLIAEMEKCPVDEPLSLRLLGVRMSNLSEEASSGRAKQTTISKMFEKQTVSAGRESSSNYCLVTESVASNTLSEASDKHGSDSVNPEKILPSLDNYCPSSSNIDATVTNSSKNAQLICPICGEIINSKFLTALNRHIDACLDSNVKKKSFNPCVDETNNCSSSSENSEEIQEKFRPSMIDNLKILKPNLSSSSAQSVDCHSQNDLNGDDTVICHSKLRRDSTDDVNPKIHYSTDSWDIRDSLLCPVCNVVTCTSLDSLNQHLDSCLATSNLQCDSPDVCLTSPSAQCDLRNPTGKSVFENLECDGTQTQGCLPDSKSDDCRKSLQDYFSGVQTLTSCSSDLRTGPRPSTTFLSSNGESRVRGSKRKVSKKCPTINKKPRTSGIDIPITDFFL